ncbi:fungal specific transcription factor domain-containing [Fusarium albosuccineum]|uniref:Fungal specific transcription factor domain-containing n=1 Tax=Fusarium albosuccineum TaxID=1237068 RepID=A0A8H4LHZ0_9HYPO|nr:fungal specific transcription factor domain-containing [Fusarium albosuccineum]
MDNQHSSKQQACDCCRYRKTKCDRQDPCENCTRSGLPCQYAHALRRKGPRRGQGRRLAQLRSAATDQTGLDKNDFAVSTPTTFSASKSLDDQLPTNCIPGPSAGSWPTPRSGSSQPTSSHSSPTFHPPAWSPVQLQSTLAAHIDVFVEHLFPIMPVVRTDDIQADVLRLNELLPPRYALILAICATVRLQFNMDGAGEYAARSVMNIPPDPTVTAEKLLDAAEKAYRHVNPVDHLSLDIIDASYFLFATYASLEKLGHAWLYLNQSITLATLLGLDHEAGYNNLSKADSVTARRMFWILFVTERTFALQHRYPVRLRSNGITKPDVIDSECPVVMNDFVNHISIFEVLPPALYEWHSETHQEKPQGVALAHQINSKLFRDQATTSLIESQQFDTRVTQQWLRVAIWRLVFGNRPSTSNRPGTLLPFSIPVDAGRAIVESLHSVSQSSMDIHGIAIEQKLCDIGISLADAAVAPDSGFSSFEIGPRDLLCAVVKSLSNTRQGQSLLLPKLLKHSEVALGCNDPAAHVELDWSLYTNLAEHDGPSLETRSACVLEEVADENVWVTGDNFGISDVRLT